jgi:hypothetical protein
MTDFQMNRREALIVGGLGTLSLGMPGSVFGKDELDSQGNAARAESRISCSSAAGRAISTRGT